MGMYRSSRNQIARVIADIILVIAALVAFGFVIWLTAWITP